MYSLQIIPLVYVLLIGKSTDDYNDFFEQLLLQYDYEPESILVDFENATLKSIKTMFPNATPVGNFSYDSFCPQKCIFRINRLYVSFRPMFMARITSVRL